jgi:hypothetical protein
LGNGKSVFRYQITDIGSSLEIGTFCHENGHMLCGFPDLYDYGYDSTGGAGSYCLMGYGGRGPNPNQVCAYLKLAADWATANDLSENSNLTATLVAAPNAGYDTFYRYRRPGVATEYFLLENRQRVERDASLLGAGIAVWHIDELGDRDDQSLVPNSVHANYEVTLVQADNRWDFQHYVNYGDVHDYYEDNHADGYVNRLDDLSAPSASLVGWHQFRYAIAQLWPSGDDYVIRSRGVVTVVATTQPPANLAADRNRTLLYADRALGLFDDCELTIAGTATSGTDYTSLGTAVDFAPGSATAIKTVTVNDDATWKPRRQYSDRRQRNRLRSGQSDIRNSGDQRR